MQALSRVHFVDKKKSWVTHIKKSLHILSQIIFVYSIGFDLSFILYVFLEQAGIDITLIIYIFIVFALLITAYLIWLENFLALKPLLLPVVAKKYPSASAIISAYLPNEADTIIETIEKFLQVEYSGKFQIILAYNTPRKLPIEKKLQRIALRNPRLQLLHVTDSQSKAQNINAALTHVKGKFVGIFDADHHLDPDSFTRAWHWLSNGYDIVQGHCIIRNGDESWLARMIAIEFEIMYSLSHVGRNRLHGFGIFGGSNGYWNTTVLRKIQMDHSMLTEDIDSSLRAVTMGYEIATDPLLGSRELAPLTMGTLWNQRMRWAQGWVQVSIKHLPSALYSNKLSFRQKLGMVHLLGWREIYPWISMQIVPLVVFWALKYHGIQHLNWFIPIFVITTIFTQLTGPAQIFFAYLVAAPEIRKHKGWFFSYLFFSVFFYASLKNLICIVAQVKEFMNEHDWKVTPRTVRKYTVIPNAIVS